MQYTAAVAAALINAPYAGKLLLMNFKDIIIVMSTTKMRFFGLGTMSMANTTIKLKAPLKKGSF